MSGYLTFNIWEYCLTHFLRGKGNHQSLICKSFTPKLNIAAKMERNIENPVSIKTLKHKLIRTSAEESVISESEGVFHYRKHNIDLVHANISPHAHWRRIIKCRIQRKYQIGLVFNFFFKLAVRLHKAFEGVSFRQREEAF